MQVSTHVSSRIPCVKLENIGMHTVAHNFGIHMIAVNTQGTLMMHIVSSHLACHTTGVVHRYSRHVWTM